MPSVIRSCLHPGCRKLVSGRYCEGHARDRERAKDEQRGTAKERGYDERWARYSRDFRQRHPLCGDTNADAYPSTASQCVRERRVTAAEVVHHIKPHRLNPALMYDARNHESLCKRCHDRVVDEGDFGR